MKLRLIAREEGRHWRAGGPRTLPHEEEAECEASDKEYERRLAEAIAGAEQQAI